MWLFVMVGGSLKDGERRRMKEEDDGLMVNFLLTRLQGVGSFVKREQIRLEGLNDDVTTTAKCGRKAAGEFNSV